MFLKKILPVTLAGLALINLACLSVHGENLIVNPDFKDSDEAMIPKGWQGVPSSRIPDLIVTTQDPLTGETVGLLQNQIESWNRAIQGVRLQANVIYTLSGEFRTTEDDDSITVSIQDPSSRSIGSESRVYQKDDGWQPISFQFVSGQAGRHELRIRNNSTSDFYLRNIQLVDSGEALQPSGLAILAPKVVSIPGSVDLSFQILNQLGSSVGLDRETVRWELKPGAPSGISLNAQNGLLEIESNIQPGIEIELMATLVSDPSINESATIQLETKATLSIPRQVVLTWQNDPQSTKTISWRTDTELSEPKVYFKPVTESIGPDIRTTTGVSIEFDNLAPNPPVETTAWINTVELTGLSPDTSYHLIIPNEEAPRDVFFKTASANPKSIVFTAFSDTHRLSLSSSDFHRHIFESIANLNPDFSLAVGDLWYADMQNHTDIPVDQFVDYFFDKYESTMVAPDGRLIPILPAEGNHDGRGDGSPFFFSRFHLPEPHNYYVFHYGPDLAIITLNSGHSAGIGGEQTAWLEKTLQENQDRRWIVVQFHVSPFPSHRPMDGGWERGIRENWVPLFEKYGVDLVINGHDHVYKRSHPIRDGRIDPENGVIYIGDGIGRSRAPDADRWFIKDAASVVSFWKVTVANAASGESTLVAEPIFPFDPDHEGSIVELRKNAQGQRIGF